MARVHFNVWQKAHVLKSCWQRGKPHLAPPAAENYIWMGEPDHVFLLAPPLWATPERCAADLCWRRLWLAAPALLGTLLWFQPSPAADIPAHRLCHWLPQPLPPSCCSLNPLTALLLTTPRKPPGVPIETEKTNGCPPAPCRRSPAAFPFFYIEPQKYKHLIDRFNPKGVPIDQFDAIGAAHVHGASRSSVWWQALGCCN